MYWIQIEDFE